MNLFDKRRCALGEGPLWHPERKQLFWFDILEKRMFSRRGKSTSEWVFDTHHSAAGWIDNDTLLLASETGLSTFGIETGAINEICALEADNPVTRSNDGRADPWGGFWIGTMGKASEAKAGSIYRYYRGELRQLVPDITISNAICFAPDRSCAYYTDTLTQRIMRQPLNIETGWPDGDRDVLVDLKEKKLFPDGAVTDSDGNLWVAMWGAGVVVCFSASGEELRRVELAARQPTCPAFGGPDLRFLMVTTARHGLDAIETQVRPNNGMTFAAQDVAQGLPEPQVIL